jgi:hypothetical protein
VTEDEERVWNRGRKSAYRSLLGEIARELGYETTEGQVASLLAERLDAVRALRDVCADYGDNDWPDDLCLSDVIEKHLHRQLDADDSD